MKDDIAIKVENVSKVFRLPHEKQNSVKGALISMVRGGKRTYEKQQVLKDISFEIKKGEFFGIVGRNGSGKSTLLKMLAGIYSPTEGAIYINGKLTPFIELGVGFNPELTGRENVFLNGALLGFNRKEMAAMYDDIVAFAEIEKFMDQKLKNYSSGMQVRLAFSIAIRAETDILLIDEVLAVGDSIFQQKCFDYFKELKKSKKTVVFVSHDSGSLQQFCDRGILIEDGNLVKLGQISDIVNQYREILNSHEEVQDSIIEPTVSVDEEKRWGTRDMEVVSVSVNGMNSKPQKIFSDKDTTITINVKYKSNIKYIAPNYGITINDSSGQQIFASNTKWMEVKTRPVETNTITEVAWKIPNAFNTGKFVVNPAISNDNGSIIYDWRDELTSFKVRKVLQSTAFVNIVHDLIVRTTDSKLERASE